MRKTFLSQFENNYKIKTKQIQVKSKETNTTLNQQTSSPLLSSEITSNNNNNNNNTSLPPLTSSSSSSSSSHNNNTNITSCSNNNNLNSSINQNNNLYNSSSTPLLSLNNKNKDDNSINSLSSSSVISMILDKEQKRGEFLMKHLEKCDVTDCGPGAPSGHIPRELNKVMPESLHIDRSTANLPFTFAQDINGYIPFPKKSLEDIGWNDSPPQQTPKFSKSPLSSSRKPPKSAREYILRETIKNFIFQDIPIIPSYTRFEENNSPEITPSTTVAFSPPKNLTKQLKEIWVQQMTELNSISQDINNTDLIELSHTNSPYHNFVFEYLYCLIFGKTSISSPSTIQQTNYSPHNIISPKSPHTPSKKIIFERSPRTKQNDSSFSTSNKQNRSDEKDPKKILLKETSSLLLFLTHVDPDALPHENILLASNNFKKNIPNYSNESITRLSRPFTKLINWCILMNKLCSIILHSSSTSASKQNSNFFDTNHQNLPNEEESQTIKNLNELENSKTKEKIYEDIELFEENEANKEKKSENEIYESVKIVERNQIIEKNKTKDNSNNLEIVDI